MNEAQGHREALNRVSGQIVDAAIRVHRALGPGLLESAYQACLLFELHRRGLKAIGEVPQPVMYEDIRLDIGYRLDIVVEDAVVVELKAIDALAPIHKAQLLSYLKLSGKNLGLLINFHTERLVDGIVRLVNDF